MLATAVSVVVADMHIADVVQFASRSSFVEKGTVSSYSSDTVQAEGSIYRYSILPALSLDGILACEIIEGSFTKSTFTEFIDGLLDQMNPFPGPNSVLVMDNCRIHKSELMLEMIEER